MQGNIRSFLVNDQVVKASRSFVCIRLLTYENEQEYEFMERLLRVQSGTLPNTVFCLLAPDGKTKLTRSGRGPSFAYSNASALASGMKQVADKYPMAHENALSDTRLPRVHKVDVALNTAACDNRPLVVTVAGDRDELAKVDSTLLRLAWSEPFAGQFVFGSTTERKDLRPLAGANETSAILIVEPGTYGVSGTVMAQLDTGASGEEIQQALARALKDFTPQVKSHNAHIQTGYNLGIEWETVIPESDPQSVRAREAFKARQQRRQ
jgi:hypothetical protein